MKRTNNLPVYVTDDELRALDAHVGDGVRSQYIVAAIRHYVRSQGGAFPDEVTDKIPLTQDMTDTQRNYATLYNEGLNYTEIADRVGVTRQAVSLALKKVKGEWWKTF